MQSLHPSKEWRDELDARHRPPELQKPESKYLDVTKMAEAGPKGHLSGGDALKKETELVELRRMADNPSSTRVALRHWYFVFYVLGETEEALQDAGHM